MLLSSSIFVTTSSSSHSTIIDASSLNLTSTLVVATSSTHLSFLEAASTDIHSATQVSLALETSYVASAFDGINPTASGSVNATISASNSSKSLDFGKF
jgi:hypothetical protein